jgi:Ca2+-binding RTX toxin-like protein
MSKIRYTDLMPRREGLFYDYDNTGYVAIEKNSHEATYRCDTGYRITIEGKDFHYHGNVISKGTVESVHMTDKHGNDLMVVTDLPVSASVISHDLVDKSLNSLIFHAFGGNDTWTGSDGDDAIYAYDGNDKLYGGDGSDALLGNHGRDKLWGGDGTDYFFIQRTYGKDTVMDFHVTGGDGVQDVVGVNGDYTLRQRGDDTIVSIGNGDVLVLKNVDMSDLTADNFYVF